MNKPKYQMGDRTEYMNCPNCSGKLILVEVDNEKKFQCNQCQNFYVPLATTPWDGEGWTDDDWEDLHNG